MSIDLDYVPMPDAVKAQVRKVWGEIKDGSGKVIAVK
jgi:phosphate transport system substrate-binding protein